MRCPKCYTVIFSDANQCEVCGHLFVEVDQWPLGFFILCIMIGWSTVAAIGYAILRFAGLMSD